MVEDLIRAVESAWDLADSGFNDVLEPDREDDCFEASTRAD